MRKIILGVAVLALVAAAPATATGFSLYGSGWNPKAIEDALGGGLGVSFPFGDGPLALDVRGTYYRDADLDNVGNDDDDVFGTLQIVPVDVALRWEPEHEGRSSFYLGGGASYMFLSLSDSDFDIEDEVGWLGFVGARFGSFFLEGAYRNAKGTVEGDDLLENGIRRRADIDLDGPVINAGWNWSF